QHPPLFFALAAGLFRLLGPGMLALRLLSVAFCLGTLALLPALGRMVVARPTVLVQDQGTQFDLAGVPPDRSRRGLPCDRSRRPAANQTNPPETTLVTTQAHRHGAMNDKP